MFEFIFIIIVNVLVNRIEIIKMDTPVTNSVTIGVQVRAHGRFETFFFDEEP